MVVYCCIKQKDHMQRIIYLNEEYGYCVADVPAKQLEKKLQHLISFDVQIICILEMEPRKLVFKCKNFELHLQLMKLSYPTTFLGKVFNKIRLRTKPSRTLISALESQLQDVNRPVMFHT